MNKTLTAYSRDQMRALVALGLRLNPINETPQTENNVESVKKRRLTLRRGLSKRTRPPNTIFARTKRRMTKLEMLRLGKVSIKDAARPAFSLHVAYYV